MPTEPSATAPAATETIYKRRALPEGMTSRGHRRQALGRGGFVELHTVTIAGKEGSQVVAAVDNPETLTAEQRAEIGKALDAARSATK